MSDTDFARAKLEANLAASSVESLEAFGATAEIRNQLKAMGRQSPL